MDRRALQYEVEQLLYREVYCLDLRKWAEWLALFTEDVEYWMPAWVSEEELAHDPATQLSMIHIRNRDELDDRVFRINTRDSYASTPLPRYCHVLGNVLIIDADAPMIAASASWTVHQYAEAKGARVHGGRYEYGLRREDGDLKIARKKIIFLNDRVDVPIDIYNI